MVQTKVQKILKANYYVWRSPRGKMVGRNCLFDPPTYCPNRVKKFTKDLKSSLILQLSVTAADVKF